MYVSSNTGENITDPRMFFYVFFYVQVSTITICQSGHKQQHCSNKHLTDFPAGVEPTIKNWDF
jgi:hypothetical protein